MHHSRNGFLTAKGLKEAAQRHSLEGLDPLGVREYVDTVGSVSALVEVEDDFDYDLNHVELNYGSAPLLQLEMFHHGTKTV